MTQDFNSDIVPQDMAGDTAVIDNLSGYGEHLAALYQNKAAMDAETTDAKHRRPC